jgi:hypothetical protein
MSHRVERREHTTPRRRGEVENDEANCEADRPVGRVQLFGGDLDIGGSSNVGQITQRPDPNLPRGYNWESSAVLRHELFPRMSVSTGFYHRDVYKLQEYDYQSLSANDWTALSIATPTDPRLPLSGQPIPLHILKPAKVGVATDKLIPVRRRTSRPATASR